ncbi:hypothetical protein DUNSADRAFT_7795 [Dunaliella salina]|uniref:Uncharacterized protein n=1 Tax=Dunaliella salina TaxID=3046 RepID=A0ABQ7GKR6_DUNSA|nr:hypothetical protein DUNSADRAFT_7795 [Dunaliella salina]|eukprot:KAF5835166.1 hypothetical protein DUNSADRAFT_7795 [Dunaliella salina]
MELSSPITHVLEHGRRLDRLASKMRAIESVVDKINLAIKGAPPILPAEDEGVNPEDTY